MVEPKAHNNIQENLEMSTANSGRKKEMKLRLTKTHLPRVVVVGGGFAGLSFIKSLKNAKIQLVLLDQNNFHVFRPLMYQVATAGLEPGAISNSLRGMFHKQNNIHFRKAEVNKILADRYRVLTTAGVIDYDYLVLACGSTGNFFNNKAIERHALTINNLRDALHTREKFIQNFEEAILKNEDQSSRLMNVVIVGGGPTGVELAGALAELRKNVLSEDYPDYDTDNLTIYLVEAQKRLLPTMSKKSGQKAKKYLSLLGVKILCNTSVDHYDKKTVALNDGKEIESNLLLWAAGLKGNLPEGFNDAQLEKGRLIVDEFNRVAGMDNIFAIGDIAFQKHENNSGALPMLAPVAIQQSKHLARNIKRRIKGKSLIPFTYHDKGVMATVGRNKAVVELPGNIGFAGRLGWLFWMFVHLLSIVGLRESLLS